MTTNVLITGGLGYLGGRIASYLLAHPEYKVILGSRAIPQPIPAGLAGATTHRMDVLSERDVTEACQGVTAVIHLAALNEVDSLRDPEAAVAINTQGTVKVLRAAKAAGVRRFIYLSTAHVYGAPLAGTITESTPCRPVHPYAITHRAAEDFVLAAHEPANFQGLVIRLSNGIGAPLHPGVNRWTLIGNDLCRQAVETRELVLKSAGLQKRDFITLEDVAYAMRHLLELPPDRFSANLFNLGGERPLRIIDVARLIATRCETILGFRPPIRHPEPGNSDVTLDLDFRLDALKSTGFHLTGSLESEIDRTLILCNEHRTKETHA